jgi:alanyl-tRNA synthetase
MGDHFPELRSSKDQIAKIILEEELAFLKTLGKGLKMIGKMISDLKKSKENVLPGKIAFELYDTYGFPVDLTQLILRENGMKLDTEGFEKEMQGQKSRSREDGTINAGDWEIVRDTDDTLFTGYEKTEDEVLISKYRIVKIKGREFCQLVFNKTPFYAESGGQVGDSGYILSDAERIDITDTINENNLIIHIAKKSPSDPKVQFKAIVDIERRQMIANNHTATHLIHYALRAVLGKHVEQKGSLVTPDRLRFDFSHYSKISREELTRVEMIANKMVRENHRRKVTDNISVKKAKAMGAMALFGEKYGESVRVVEFGNSVELCGGTHVDSTSSIGIIKIISEGAIAAGIRRIEAVTAGKADEYISEKLADAEEVALLLKIPGKISDGVGKLIAENSSLKKTIEKYQQANTICILKDLETKALIINNIRYISGQVESDSPDILKTIAFEVRKSSENSVLVIGAVISGKANIVVMVSDKLVKEMNINAVEIIKEIAPEINGGGGGQPFLATAGGKNPDGIKKAIKKAEEYLRKL